MRMTFIAKYIQHFVIVIYNKWVFQETFQELNWPMVVQEITSVAEIILEQNTDCNNKCKELLVMPNAIPRKAAAVRAINTRTFLDAETRNGLLAMTVNVRINELCQILNRFIQPKARIGQEQI